MRLVLKLPNGKPPFIGVEFENASKGERENKDLVRQKSIGRYFKLIFEGKSTTLNIRLYSENPVVVRYYMGINYNHEVLKRWLLTAKLYKSVNFGHTYSLNSNDTICMIIEDGKKIPFVLPVDLMIVDET